VRIAFGLWRSTLGETHPHVGFDVELDYWPQSAHFTSFDHASHAVDAPIDRGLVACFAGGGGGSQPALFRKDLVPLLEGAGARWRASGKGTVDTFLAEVQRGFEELREPEWHVHFDATVAAVHFTEKRFTVATNGLERIFRFGPSGITRVARGRSMLDNVTPEDLAKTEPSIRDLYASMAAARLGAWRNPVKERWQTKEVALARGESLLLLTGEGFADQRIEEGIARFPAEATAPEQARILGEYLADPASWTSPPDAKEDEPRKIEWRVASRTAIAIVRDEA